MPNYNFSPVYILSFIVVIFFSIVWIPVFIVFYILYSIGSALSFMDESDQVGLCQTKYSMFLFFLHSMATVPYYLAWGMLWANKEIESREKRKVDFTVNFEDKSTHGSIDKDKVLAFITQNNTFKKVFGYKNEIDKEFYMDFFDYNKEEVERYEKRVVWLYWSDYNGGAMIGMTKNKNAIFCIDRDYNKIIISRKFYEMPFLMFLNQSHCTIGQIPWKAERNELDMEFYQKLKSYNEWIKENNINVKQNYINMLN